MRELPIPRIVVNPWQFLTRSILTPAHRLAVCVDEYAVRPSLLHERFLVATISLDQFCARISIVFRLRAPPVTVHTPTRIRSRRWMSLEEALEIAPCPFGELLRRVFRVSRHCDNRICLSTIPAHNYIERQSSSPHVFGQGIRVREAVAALTRMCGYGNRSVGSLGQELSDGLVSVVALTDFHQAGKMEFHPGFDFARRNAGVRMIRAYYRWQASSVNVTEVLRSKTHDGQLSFVVTNSTMGGDPAVGADKVLAVIYRYQGSEAAAIVREGYTLTLP